MIAVKNPLQTFNLFWNYKIYRWAKPHEFVWCQYDPPTECSLLKHNINISSLLFIDVSRTISTNLFGFYCQSNSSNGLVNRLV